MNSTDINYYIPDDTRIIKWHITDNGELDYTIYEEADGGRLHILPNDKIETILEEL